MRILLVEDSPGDVRLTQEALREANVIHTMVVVSDGVAALNYLRGRANGGGCQPDLILLDLNLPRKDGREVLAEIKQDTALRHIPVIVLTTSGAEDDICKAYNLQASCYITKPRAPDQFHGIAKKIENLWLSCGTLPGNGESGAGNGSTD